MQYLLCHNMGCNGYNASELHDGYLWQSPPEAVLHENDPVAVFPGENIAWRRVHWKHHDDVTAISHVIASVRTQYSDSRLNEDNMRMRFYIASEFHSRIFHTAWICFL